MLRIYFPVTFHKIKISEMSSSVPPIVPPSVPPNVFLDEIVNTDYISINEIIHRLISDHCPNLSQEHKEQNLKYGIIREQRDVILCKEIENIFISGF